MKQFILIIIYILALILNGCAPKTVSVDYETVEIDLTHAVRCAADDYSGVLGAPQYTLLRSLNKNDIIGSVDKVVVTDHAIYVADLHSNKIVSYSKQGVPQKVLCRIGRGPGEYLSLCDFCVDRDGNLYVNDARINKVIKYDADFNYLKDWKLTYDIDSFEILDNDKFLAVLSAWNEGEYEKTELALLNNNLEIETQIIMYDEFVDDNFEMAQSKLSKTDFGIFYHRTINDNVYLLDYDAKITRIYHFNFGERTVQDKEKQNIEKYLNNLKNRTFLSGQVVIFPKNVYGTLCDRMENQQFVWARENNTIRIEKCQDEVPSIGVICGAIGNELFTYLPADNCNSEVLNLVDMNMDEYSLILCTYEIE